MNQIETADGRVDQADQAVRLGVAAADRRRRVRDSSREMWRVAPMLAAVSLVVAGVSRWAGWPAALPLGVLGASVLALVVRSWAQRRDRPMSDRIAAQVDADAGLGGELRSASWFATRPSPDIWATYHVDRAADRVQRTDWTQLYPSVPTLASRLSTAAMVLGAIALAITLPARVEVRAERAVTAPALAAVIGPMAPLPEGLSPELVKQLEALLASAESGALSEVSKGINAASLQDLASHLEQLLRDPEALKELARAMDRTPAPRTDQTAPMLQALGDRVNSAAAMAAIPPEAREALKEFANGLKDVAQEERTAEATAAAKEAAAKAAQKAKADESAAPGSSPDVDQLSMEFSKDDQGGAGAGLVMMSNQEMPAAGAQQGVGAGGGSGSGKNGGGKMAGIDQALRRETVEASTDNSGQNVLVESRRKTEHGDASVAFTHSAAGAFDRSHAAAPPDVPEARRVSVQNYFIRQP